MATGLRPKQMCGVNIAMTMTVVRCPHCVSDSGFRPMIARWDGRFVCNRCGHSAIPGGEDFKCSCWKCSRRTFDCADAASRTLRFLRKLGWLPSCPIGGTMKIVVRNAPCPCGSGRKYKRCHGSNSQGEFEGKQSGFSFRLPAVRGARNFTVGSGSDEESFPPVACRVAIPVVMVPLWSSSWPQRLPAPMKHPNRPKPLWAAKSQPGDFLFIPPCSLNPHVPIFLILTPVLPERRRTENLTSRADRFPPMPPRNLEISRWLWG